MREQWWRPAVASLAGFAMLTALLAWGAFLEIDVAIRDWSDAHRPEPARQVAKLLYFLGSANLIAAILLVLAVLLAVRDRTVRPPLLVVGTAALSYVVVVPLKMWTDRSAPHAPWPQAVELFAHDEGWSYPSGHVVNTLIWYPVLALLVEQALRRPLSAPTRRAVLLAPVVIVFVAVTYLGFHWVTDCVAGVLLGVALRSLLARPRGSSTRTPTTPPGAPASGSALQEPRDGVAGAAR